MVFKCKESLNLRGGPSPPGIEPPIFLYPLIKANSDASMRFYIYALGTNVRVGDEKWKITKSCRKAP